MRWGMVAVFLSMSIPASAAEPPAEVPARTVVHLDYTARDPGCPREQFLQNVIRARTSYQPLVAEAPTRLWVTVKRDGRGHALPLFLLTPTAHWKAARAAPDVSLAAQARGWGRLMRATATNRVTRALASWVGLAPAKLVGAVALAATMGAAFGAALHAALSPTRDVGSAHTSGERQAWATSDTPPPFAMIQGTAATPVDSVTAMTSAASPGHSARPGGVGEHHELIRTAPRVDFRTHRSGCGAPHIVGARSRGLSRRFDRVLPA